MRFGSFTMRNLDIRAGLGGGGPLARLLAAAVVTVPLAACSSIPSFDVMNPTSWFAEKYKTKIEPDVPADTLYDRGLANLQRQDYEAAGKTFADLEKRYSFSQWQRKGLLMATFSQYQNGKYDDAIGTAQRYITSFPNSTDTPYAYYIEAMSYYNLIPDVTRDQDRAEKAASLFATIVDKYPKSEYAEDARYKLQITRDQLAGKEMEVGRYYLHDRNFTAAINRFRIVLAKYQTTRHAEEALMRLVEAYLALGIVNEAQTAAAVLGHNFPDSPWYKDAFARLKENGTEPQEDKGSWISKAFHKVGVG
jgi:outer membrane protein assembly factor BamD